MRILFVSQYYFPDQAAGGPVVKIGAITERMIARGHDVTVITAESGSGLYHQAQDDHGSSMDYSDGTKVFRLATWLKYRATSINPAIWSISKSEVPRADVIHLFGYYDFLGPVVGHLAQSRGIPFVMEPMGMYVPILRSYTKKRLYHWMLGRRLVNAAARIVATSSLEKIELIGSGIRKDKVFERRNGVDLAEFSTMPKRGYLRSRLGLSDAEQIVLYLGRVTPKKNPEMLLRAFANTSLSDARLVIVGPESENNYLPYLRDVGKSLGIEDRVSFVGALYGQEKLGAFADADLFVLPSQSENFGNAAAEAVAAGVPVVVSDQCGIAPIVDGRVGLVVPADEKSVSTAINRLLTEDSLKERYKRACPVVAHELSWDDPVEAMEGLYENIVRETEKHPKRWHIGRRAPLTRKSAKRVLLVSQYYMPSRHYGGPVVKLKGLAETLVSRGHQVTVLTSAPQQGNIERHEAANGIDIVYLRSLARYRAVTLNPGVWQQCYRFMPDFDVVHVFGVYDLLGPVAAFHAARCGRPYVLEPLGMALPILRSISKKRLYHFIVGKDMFRKASRVIATSQREYEQLLHARIVPEERLLLRRNGVDLSDFVKAPGRGSARKALGLDPKSRLVLYLGRLAPVKSLDLLIRAFAQLDVKDTKLILAGPEESDGYKKGLEKLISDLGLGDQVIFTGPVYGDRKVGLLTDADVLVLPSVYESFGNAAAEAVAAGTPVVVTENCGIAPIIRDRVGLVADHTDLHVADALRQLLVQPELHKTFTDECPVIAKELTWDEPVTQMETLYNALDNGGN